MSSSDNFTRRLLLKTLAAAPAISSIFGTPAAQAQAAKPTSPLASWNAGPAKQAILDFVRQTTDPASPSFVPPVERIATFDQDGTLRVEQPMYSQVMYCLEQIPALVKAKPELAYVEPFKTVMTGDLQAIAKLPMPELEKILGATLAGMSVDELHADVMKWLPTAKDRRWKRPYTDLTYLRCRKC